MKRTIKIIILFLLILLPPLSLLSVGLSLPDYYNEAYYAELPDMLHRLQSAESPRLIVLGNSDVAFGLDGALLESLLAKKGIIYTVCPFGLYGAVGTGAMLSLSEKELRKDDLVVFVVEPVSETLSTYFGATAFWKCCESDLAMLLALNKDQRQAMIGNYLDYLQTRFSYLINNTRPEVRGIYTKASFNDRCDLTFDRPGNLMLLGFDPTSPVVLSEVNVSHDFAEQFSAFCRKAEQVGAHVCISFSPINRSAVTDPDAVLSFFNRIRKVLPYPFISNPNRYIMDSGWFYDTNFHLNSAGAVLRTVELARDIAAFEGCCEPIEYTMPAMPMPLSTASAETGDETAFSYTPFSDKAWLINGLTESGKAMTALTVPAIFESKPVIGFTPSALYEASALKTLILTPNVESLPDYLFSKCPSLSRLVLTHTERPCGISAHTFDSAEKVRILIPAAAYSLYHDGYGCAQNPWEAYLNRIELY